MRPFLPQTPDRGRIIGRTLLLGGILYILYEWPLWLRNFFLRDDGRTVYAYPNWDVHPASFVVQEIVVLGFCVLIATVWVQWLGWYEAVSSEPEQPPPWHAELMLQLSDAFTHWQVASIVLALGFFFFTNFFWDLVGRFGDQRYVISALQAHGLWGATWVIMSLPLIAQWRKWQRLRLRASAAAAAGEEALGALGLKDTAPLDAFSPVGFASLAASQALAVVSFLWPAVKAALQST